GGGAPAARQALQASRAGWGGRARAAARARAGRSEQATWHCAGLSRRVGGVAGLGAEGLGALAIARAGWGVWERSLCSRGYGSARFARAGLGALALLARVWERSLCSRGTGSARFARAGLGALAIARAGMGALALLARVWERSLCSRGGGDGGARSGRPGALARVGAAGGRGPGRSALRAGRGLRGHPAPRPA